jgi:hypothetical protein
MTKTLTNEEIIKIERLRDQGFPTNVIIEDIVSDRCSEMKDEMREDVRRSISDFML